MKKAFLILLISAAGAGAAASIPYLLRQVGGDNILVMRNIEIHSRHLKRHFHHLRLP